MEAMVRYANKTDAPKLLTFLQKAKLETNGVTNSIEYFLLMEDESGNLKATLGLEPAGRLGLLRSLVLTEGMTEKDLLLLIEQMLVLAKEKQLRSLYMATNKKNSILFFKIMGFSQITEKELPEELCELEHIQNILTVDNSFFMVINV